MRVARTAVIALALGILPGSCIAASTTKPAPKVAVAKPAVKTQPRPVEPRIPVTVGKFALDRTPEQGSLSRGQTPPGTIRLVVNGEDVAIAPDGRFVIGFGRDYANTVLITAFQDGGKSVSERVTVAKRQWKIENLKTLPHHSQPDAEYQARRPGEIAQINASRRIPVTSDGWRQQFRWPVKGRISGFFGSQRIYAGEPGSPHSGVDVAVPTGTPLAAPADGVVVLAASAPFTLEGNLLIVNHGLGLSSVFLHLSRIDVKVGDTVKQGQQIGAVGMTGRATGPHMHWSLRWHDERMDPQPLAGAM
jgi:murein DD-endopeptidase MepM/ murein hydrolase activator NlpD